MWLQPARRYLLASRSNLYSLSMAEMTLKFSLHLAIQLRIQLVVTAVLFGWNLRVKMDSKRAFLSTAKVLMGLRRLTGSQCSLHPLGHKQELLHWALGPLEHNAKGSTSRRLVPFNCKLFSYREGIAKMDLPLECYISFHVYCFYYWQGQGSQNESIK